MDNQRTVNVTIDGEEKELLVIKPRQKQHVEAQIAYNKALREALDSGAFLRKELYKNLKERGVWDEAKEKEEEKILTKISDLEDKIRAGGLRLSELKETAIDIKKLRAELQLLIADRNSEDRLTAESQAENYRFYSYICSCILYKNRNRVFSSLEDYDEKSDQDWAIDAVEELANLIYGLDQDFENKYVENRFLKKYGIVDENYNFIDDDGNFVDKDGRRVDKDGYYIDEDGNRVNKKGHPVDENGDYLDAAPMLDDDGNPIVLDDEKSEKEEEKTPKKKRGRPKKKESVE